MTLEQIAALQRLRRLTELGTNEFAEGSAGWQQDEFVSCLTHAANVALADHPADDDEPVTLEEVAAAIEAYDGNVQLLPVMDCGVDIFGTVKIKTRRQLRELLKGLGHNA